ncbi:MAG: tRNA pseudouridine(55) synthase TruB [Candidatus Omnitrophica bacterium]|nr:tRNA pseudouridine(55) synthase TruB [Candidatus Omnitrophota bacterium]
MIRKDGIIIIDKPAGLSSHDVVLQVRRRLKVKKVGHAGTLDPMATGVLVVFVGSATKLFGSFSSMDKEYAATFRLGKATDTGDLQGKVIKEMPYAHITEGRVREVFKLFTGDIEQVPPMTSALKHKGSRLYELARKGISVERAPRKLKIYDLELKNFNPPDVEFYLKCSKGTYVRKLAEDIAEALSCCAYISQIRRLSVGGFTLDKAVKLDDVNEGHILYWKN